VKKILPILLVFILLNQSFFIGGYVIYWKVNQSVIAKTLCENRNKPKLHCDGKCNLRKKLALIEDKSESNNSIPSAISKLKSPDAFVLINYKDHKISFLNHKNTNPNFNTINPNLLKGYPIRLFLPPKFS